ncbi:MAG: helix-turn-helix domain-containing protein [Fibromonadales bacterium]|nr:helix-turn-helix domain-containing protein [Fibromonadales bacterium]
METKDGIKSFRDRLRLNQAELAEKLGIVQGNITAWESGRGTPSFQISKKLLELGITVEELFGVEYNEMHKLEARKTSPTSYNAELQQKPKKLIDFEADLLRKMLDYYACIDYELENIKKWKEVYKLEREIERGDNTTDLAAKKQRLQELQEQIEDEFIWLKRFDARREIKTLEDDLEQMEETERRNSYEKPDRIRRILDLQKQIEKDMYYYVDLEIIKREYRGETSEKFRKFWLDQQIRKLREQIKETDNKIEQNEIRREIEELEKELESLEKGG